MTVWTIKKNAVWGIYAEGKYVTAADNEEDAKMLLESIDANEKSDEIAKSHPRITQISGNVLNFPAPRKKRPR